MRGEEWRAREAATRREVRKGNGRWGLGLHVPSTWDTSPATPSPLHLPTNCLLVLLLLLLLLLLLTLLRTLLLVFLLLLQTDAGQQVQSGGAGADAEPGRQVPVHEGGEGLQA